MRLHHAFGWRLLRRVSASTVRAELARCTEHPASDDDLPSVHNNQTAQRLIEAFSPHLASFVDEQYADPNLSFDPGTAYGAYNWELFFHGCLLNARRLAAEGHFEPAIRWLEVIATRPDTTGGFAWRLPPLIDVDDSEATLDVQLRRWLASPFDPHAVAMCRPRAYRAVFTRYYVSTLNAWGDALFREDTAESIQAAMLRYVEALRILGPVKPAVPPPKPASDAPRTFRTLRAAVSGFADVPPGARSMPSASKAAGERFDASVVELFCAPANRNMDELRAIATDRLFKIRNSLNIDGVFRVTPLFAPPIDPGDIVAAMAGSGGARPSSLANRLAAVPPVRFGTLARMARAAATEVRQLGGAIVSALEKRDAEAVTLLRSNQEVRILRRAVAQRETQLEEAIAQREGVGASRAVVETRLEYYNGLIDDAWLKEEEAQIGLMGTSGTIRAVAEGLSLSAAPQVAAPQVMAGGLVGPFGGPMVLTETNPVPNVGSGLSTAASALSMLANAMDVSASVLGITASYRRRRQDWEFQRDTAAKELENIDKQIRAADLRVTIAEQELKQEQRRVEDAQQVAEFYERKYTNQQLYGWMADRLRTLHRRYYNLALDAAKMAEAAYRYELGDPQARLISTTHADARHGLLLAGESLLHEIDSMELTYVKNNRREIELVCEFSLAEWDPIALLRLRETGECHFETPEAALERDAPGFYFRRLREVTCSMTPSRGPHVAAACRVTLLSSRIRKPPPTGDEGNGDWDDPTQFMHRVGQAATIVTSHADDDSGMFSAPDERFGPFEGHGAIGSWRLVLPKTVRSFDYHDIADVVLRLRMTARDAGDLYRAKVEDSLKGRLAVLRASAQGPVGPLAMVSLRRDLPDVFAELLTMEPDTHDHVSVSFPFNPLWMPAWLRKHVGSAMVPGWHAFVRGGVQGQDPTIDVGPESSPEPVLLNPFAGSEGLHFAAHAYNDGQPNLDDDWSVGFSTNHIDRTELQDILLVFRVTPD